MVGKTEIDRRNAWQHGRGKRPSVSSDSRSIGIELPERRVTTFKLNTTEDITLPAFLSAAHFDFARIISCGQRSFETIHVEGPRV